VEVLLRADASATIGVGHLARTLTLASALRDAGARCTFVTCAPSAATVAWLQREGHRYVELEVPTSSAQFRLRAGSADWIVVDGYHLDRAYQTQLRELGRVCVFDDLGTSEISADIVLNGNLYGERVHYPPAAGRLLLGPRYALVRSEFLGARVARECRVSRAERRRIFVTMGGSDPTGATEEVLAALESLPACDVHVAVGGNNPRFHAIRAAAERQRSHRVVVSFEPSMSTEMALADLIVTAAGSTCLELCTVGVSGVAVAVVENQRRVAEALDDAGLMLTVASPADIGLRLPELLRDPRRCRAMEAAQRNVVDGRGKERVAAELLGTRSAG